MSNPAPQGKDDGRLIGVIATVLGVFLRDSGHREENTNDLRRGPGPRRPPIGDRLVAWLGIVAAVAGAFLRPSVLSFALVAIVAVSYWSWRRGTSPEPLFPWFVGLANVAGLLAGAALDVVGGIGDPADEAVWGVLSIAGGAAGTLWMRRRSRRRERPVVTLHMPGVMENEDLFVRMLIELVPTVAALHSQFLNDYEGEELPYLFLEAYVAPWLATELRGGRLDADAKEVLDAMDAAISAYDDSAQPPDPADNLVRTMFTEGVLREGIGQGDRLLPPKLASWSAAWKPS